MRVSVLAVGRRSTAWVSDGFNEYARRLSGVNSMQLVEIPLAQRTSRQSSIAKAVAAEGERLVGAIPKGARAIALDQSGRQWSTEQLAKHLERWAAATSEAAFLIGGPDGMAQNCLERADDVWSLSALTLPHGLVRVIVAEQLYRAFSLINNHPYHRM